jgi:hypothetical protein
MPGGALPSFAQTHWLAAGLFIRLGWEETTKSILDHLAARLRDDLHASALCWMPLLLNAE